MALQPLITAESEVRKLRAFGLPVDAELHWRPAHHLRRSAARLWSGRPRQILGICYHTAEEPADARAGTVEYFESPPPPRTSAGYFSATTGDFYQMVRDEHFAFTQGGGDRATDRLPRPDWWNAELYGDYNNVFISLEVEGCSDDARTYPSSPCGQRNADPTIGGIGATVPIGGRQWAAIVAWTAWICQKYAIPLNRRFLVRHSELSNQKADPGPGFPLDSIIEAAQSYLGGQLPPGAAAPYVPTYSVPTQRSPTPASPAPPPAPPSRALSYISTVGLSSISGLFVPSSASQPRSPADLDSIDGYQPPNGDAYTSAGLPNIYDFNGEAAAGERAGRGVRTLSRRRTQMMVDDAALVDDDYRVKFDIEYNEDDEQPSRVIEFYNLRGSTVRRLLRRGSHVNFRAGYDQGPFGTIALGEVIDASWEWKPPDRILHLLIGGRGATKQSQKSVTISGAVRQSYRVKFDILARAAGLHIPREEFDRFPELETQTFHSYIGDPWAGIKQFAANLHMDATEQLGVIHFTRRPAPVPQLHQLNEAFLHGGAFDVENLVTVDDATAAEHAEQVRDLAIYHNYIRQLRGDYTGVNVAPIEALPYVISEANGMIGSPTETAEGVEVKVRLSNAPRLQQQVQVEIDGEEKEFIINRVKHVGDTWSGDFSTTIGALALSLDGGAQ